MVTRKSLPLGASLRRLTSSKERRDAEIGRFAAAIVLSWVRAGRARRAHGKPPWHPADLHAFPPRGDGGLFRSSIERLLMELVLARPGSAACLHLANENFLALEALTARRPAPSRQAVLGTVERATERFVRALVRTPRAVRRAGGRLARSGTRLVCYAPGPLVEEALRAARRRRRRIIVSVSEGRPDLAGAAAAARLARGGLRVEIFSDAALFHGLEGAAALVLEAHAVSRDGAIAAAGSAGLAELAASRRVPVVVACGPEAHLPPALAAFIREEAAPGRPSKRRAASRPTYRFPRFDLTPLELIQRLLTPWGLLAREEAAALLGNLRCSPRLQRALVGRLGRPQVPPRRARRVRRRGRSSRRRR